MFLFTSRNGEKNIHCDLDGRSRLVSSTLFTVFKVKNTYKNFYQNIWFIFSKEQNLTVMARFNSWGMPRETFDWRRYVQCKNYPFRILKWQEAIVTIYHTLETRSVFNGPIKRKVLKKTTLFQFWWKGCAKVWEVEIVRKNWGIWLKQI